MTTSIKTRVLDRIDLAILDALHKNGRISNVNLAKAVNLSPSPCLDRVKKLESEGYIEGYSARLNPEKLGQHLVAHVEIRLKSSTESVFETFKQHIIRIPHVVSCDMVAGGFDYLVKIRIVLINGAKSRTSHLFCALWLFLSFIFQRICLP